ncbi:PAS domain S-box protein [Roseibium sp. RKSG952]|nr:ATP-binding protein [Roseibium sp. RKSG952]MTH99792.1 PAS domain S-box protein [Roseibium sp. RKSG952]
MPVLAGLIDDKRAAWLWSADGSGVLWANAAGAQFFSINAASDLAQHASSARSPAQSQIARIAQTGSVDRMSLDRLRFHRGLQVMVLTCECQRLQLDGGRDAALIVAADSSLALDVAPADAFLAFVSGHTHSAYLCDANNRIRAAAGVLKADLLQTAELTASEKRRLTLNGETHFRIEVPLPDGTALGVVDNTPVSPAQTSASASQPPRLWLQADEPETADDNRFAHTSFANKVDPPPQISEAVGVSEADGSPPPDKKTEKPHQPSSGGRFSGELPAAAQNVSFEERRMDYSTSDNNSAIPKTSSTEDGTFSFQPNTRQVRFAWKMDLNQKFVFLSSEFVETLGPASADVIGLTWTQVVGRFGFDFDGAIANALDRRDTWSGKTVMWPVTGSDIRVPVDLAALPAFDRERKFEGYRGFGVCRTAEAVTEDGKALSPLLDLADAAAQSTMPATALGNAEKTGIAGEAAPATVASAAKQIPQDEIHPVKISPQTDNPVAQPAVGQTGITAETSEEPGAATPAETEDPAVMIDRLPDRKRKKIRDISIGATAAALVGALGRKSEHKPHRVVPAPKAKQPERQFPSGSKPPSPDRLAMRTSEAASVPANDDQSRNREFPDRSVQTTGPVPSASAAAAPSNPRADTPEPVKPVRKLTETGIYSASDFNPADIEAAVRSLSKAYDENRSRLASPSSSDPQDEPHPAGASNLTNDLTRTDTTEASAETKPSEKPETPEVQTEGLQIGPVEPDTRTDDPVPSPVDAASALDLPSTPTAVQALEPGPFREIPSLQAGETPEPAPVAAKAAEEVPEENQPEPAEATQRPELVPVDTSALSRPELAVFRKIAEALGARFEGDLSVFEAPDNDDFDEEKLLPRPVKDAGPVDPLLLDRLPIGIAIARDRDILYANDTLLNRLGYSDFAALSEAGGLEALFVDDAEEDWPDASGLEGTVDGLRKIRLADGGVRAVDARMHSVPWNGGHGLMISILERPQPQQASVPQPGSNDTAKELAQARDQIAEMDTILETATDGVLVLDKTGTIIRVNRSAEALFNANRSNMIGASLTAYLAPESHRAAADYLDGLSRNGVASILNDGREVLGQVSRGGLVPLFMTIGRVSGHGDLKFCAVLRDITQWKTAEEELTDAKRQAENASSQKSDFLAKISHEVRTPLNAIIGFSEVMMEERFGPIGNDRYRDYVKDIQTSGAHIMSLVNDLLDLSKIEAGKLDLRFAATSPNDVIGECVALMQPQANRDRVIIRASLPDAVPSVVADPRSLRQIVLNLLSNAIKFNRAGGQVIVSSSLEDTGDVILRVRDTGTGMTGKEIVAAMEPFRQLHTSHPGGGTGLGLPLTKALAEANRASFRIDSTPDQGTLVEIGFPSQRVLSD